MIRTRFAPSPTGFLHIGGARTCVFSWLQARRNKGEFVLRIEDTDRVRSKKEYLDEILESLSWLGIDWEEIFYQSKRFDIYQDYAERLVEEGKAYKKEGAIFFKYEFKEIKINDLIRGKIVFKELPKEEDVIIKSDGSPAYNFSCVIDDALMEITQIIRGEDHIPNTPKQILMYQALGFALPEFAHVPLILSEEGGRMSKRFGATSIREYRDEGYLAEALVNYLLLLSWSPGSNREIISLEEAKETFNIKDVNKTAAAFSLDKLNWLNSEYIKLKPLQELVPLVKEFLQNRRFLPEGITEDYLSKIVKLFKERTPKLADLIERAYFCFYGNFEYTAETEDILKKDLSKEAEELIKRFESLDEFGHDNIEKEFRATASDLGLKARDLVHPVRCALSGKKTGPGLFETMEALGKNTVVERLKRLIAYWNTNKPKNQQ